MTNEMIERCAKAMMDDCCPAIRMTVEDVKFYQRMASICIKAMREPTEEMLIECYKEIGIPRNPIFATMWRSMIDAVLK